MSTNKNNYKDYETFSGVNSSKLRAYNRLVTYFQVAKDLELDSAKSYITQFNDKDRADMTSIKAQMQSRGFATVRRELAQGIEYEEA